MQIPGYKIIRKINQGGMSTVYLAIQLSVGREVALKVMSPVLNADPVFSERFQREANIVGQLPHPNIVSIYDIGRYKNLNYIAMDYLPGGTVHEKMTIGMSTAEVIRTTKQVARALSVAHNKGYVHRDIKPENILFREDGMAVLTDFGVAKATSAASRVTNAGTVVGTPHYMSPEQSRGMPLDGRSDLYSLGIVFYEMLTGRVPFQGEESIAIAIKHLTEPVPKLPGQHAIFQSIVDKLLAKKSSDRFQTGSELLLALESVEETLAGYPNRRTPYTDPSSMNVMALFKALMLTSFAALRIQFLQLGERWLNWRWTPKRGFYTRPKVRVTEIRTEVDSKENQRETIVSTRVRNAAHYQEISSRQIGFITRSFTILLVIATIWSTFCIGLKRFDVKTERFLPAQFDNAVNATAGVIERYAAIVTGSSAPLTSSSIPDPGVANAETDIDYTTDQNIATDSGMLKTSAVELPELKNPISLSSIEENIDTDSETGDDSSDFFELPAIEEKTPVSEPQYSFTIAATPENARIRILNIKDKYSPGMRLKSGRYRIEVSQTGYSSQTKWVRLTQDDEFKITLVPSFKPGDVFIDSLQDQSQGPEMVVIPQGEYIMGKKGEAIASPEHLVTLKKQIAVGKYEITFANYVKFTNAKNLSAPDDKGWGKASRPVMNISWSDANDYAQWLSEQTQHHYRLPTEAEWEFFARANSGSEYWWGNTAPKGKANCKRGCDSDYATMFTAKTAPVGSYQANQFGIFDTAGNVAEWTQDCFQNHYIGVPNDGSALTTGSCAQRTVRGGSAKDNAKEIYSYSRKGENATNKSESIGFRLVLELSSVLTK